MKNDYNKLKKQINRQIIIYAHQYDYNKPFSLIHDEFRYQNQRKLPYLTIVKSMATIYIQLDELINPLVWKVLNRLSVYAP